MAELYTEEDFIKIIDSINLNKNLNPMPKDMVEKLSFAKYREFNGETMPLPTSLKQLLCYDQDFTFARKDNKLFAPLLATLDKETGIFYSTNLTEMVRSYIDDVHEIDIKWNDDPLAPAIFPLQHIGDQKVYFYVVELDNTGEYPLCRLDPSEFEFWLSEASLVHYIFGLEDIDTSFYENFVEQCQEHYKKLLDEEYFIID